MLYAALIPLVDTVVLIYRIASRIRSPRVLVWIEGPHHVDTLDLSLERKKSFPAKGRMCRPRARLHGNTHKVGYLKISLPNSSTYTSM